MLPERREYSTSRLVKSCFTWTSRGGRFSLK